MLFFRFSNDTFTKPYDHLKILSKSARHEPGEHTMDTRYDAHEQTRFLEEIVFTCDRKISKRPTHTHTHKDIETALTHTHTHYEDLWPLKDSAKNIQFSFSLFPIEPVTGLSVTELCNPARERERESERGT